ncbi:MAG TPA: EAL domain-containing protein [Noviherbaspirillum sp.]|uniref:putative bifunctional diguanylate cyclase/phosphodiesterase n=1 Tax=Noviherbaspirillum sp. TaxID=1926288 RepID=UPI002D35EF3E|nr:EAL domain-containing protein [Noviherbaspirillum sp.]HYD95972.1 EAL domain-containing protein [Noviherbaspirillum sp.]
MNDEFQENDTRVDDLAARLEASEARLHNIIERSPDAFVVVDSAGVIQFANLAAAVLFRAEDANLLVGERFGRPLTAGETIDVDIVGAHGEEIVAEMRVVETEWRGNQAYIAVLRDLTERIRSARILRENEKRLTLALDAAKLGFWDIDVVTGSMACSDRMYECLGYAKGEIRPNRAAWWALVHPGDEACLHSHFDDHLKGKTPGFRTEVRLRSKSNDWRWMLFQGEVTERGQDASPLRVIGVAEDIHERKEVEERIRHASQHDALTGLPNRALLYEFAEHLLSGARRSGGRSAFLFIDLDRFKPINDAYGHDVGDLVLKEVGRRLTASVRSADVVGRFGGDEFLMMLVNIRSEDDVAMVARHALTTLNQPYLAHGHALTISPSIGISVFPQDGDTIDDLIKNADTAMYQAKEGGRNRFQFFKPEFNKRVSESLKIESCLRQGFDRNEFEVFYQPVVDTETRSVVSAEALLRWPSMNWSPAQFIPVAEIAGFMQTLGTWTLQEVCRQQREWREKGFRVFPVAVNVSATQFRQKNFVQSVSDCLLHAGVSAADVYFEVTESTVMRNVGDVAEILHALRSMGIKVALDDFGTGYSSLSYLSQLPIDILKLDQSFIRGIGQNSANGAITEGIIGLGRSLGLEIIAEGVETQEALDFLRARKCRRGQGYHFCPPLPANDFERWCHLHAA